MRVLLASIVVLRASMAITTLCNRHFLDEGATHPRIPLLVLPLCIIWVTACDWAFLTVPFYALWLSDDILSWRRLRYHPGPWFAGISSLPTLWHIRKGDFYDWQQRSHKKYGGIARESWLIVSGRLLLHSGHRHRSQSTNDIRR